MARTRGVRGRSAALCVAAKSVSTFIGTDGGEAFADDMRLTTDLDLIAELADQAAQGALISYGLEDWQRSPLTADPSHG